jgi:hypothetical protein
MSVMTILALGLRCCRKRVASNAVSRTSRQLSTTPSTLISNWAPEGVCGHQVLIRHAVMGDPVGQGDAKILSVAWRMTKRPKPMLGGRELSPQELERIRTELEFFDEIEHVSDEMRALIADQWPHLLDKLPPRLRPRRKPGTRPRRLG